MWSLTSADEELGLIYVPTGNGTPDYFGGHRTEAMDQYASSIVALDAGTGRVRWSFQTTHHDIWDYDVPSQPTLVDIPVDGVYTQGGYRSNQASGSLSARSRNRRADYRGSRDRDSADRHPGRTHGTHSSPSL